jgi:hypothetical protein
MMTFVCGCSHHPIRYRDRDGNLSPAPVYITCAQHRTELRAVRRERWDIDNAVWLTVWWISQVATHNYGSANGEAPAALRVA